MTAQTPCPITHALNEQQAEAATCDASPCLVLAGPGTGKTTTLTARFKYLVSQGVDPHRIMAVTFTRKAADQLKERIQLRSSQLSIGTFHSLAGRMLRPYAELVNRTPHFQIFDAHQQKGLLIDLKIFWNPENGGDLMDIIGGAKEQLLTPELFARSAEDLYKEGRINRNHYLFEAAQHFHTYEQALTNADACDFADLIAKTVRVLENHEEVRQQEAARFDHLLVDEYQDVNPAQIRLMDALLFQHKNIWAVGDDDQSIYGFRNADVAQILNFKTTYAPARLTQLTQNYRSTPQILALANNLITRNKQRHNKRLTATRPQGPKVVMDLFQTPQQEADWIADAVEKVLARGIPVTEIAVLFRVSHISSKLQVAFSRKKIPFVLRGAGDFWESLEVRAFLGLLRLAADPRDKKALYLLGSGKRAERLLQKARFRKSGSFSKQVKWAREQVGQETPYNATPERSAAWEENLRTAAQVAEKAQSLDALFLEIQAQSVAIQRKEGEAIVLTTIHSAKGLEWHTVFVAGFEDGIIPHGLAEDQEEERRLAYVAVTRCKRFLSISLCKTRNGEDRDPSPFLAEALTGVPEDVYDWRCKDRAAPRLSSKTRPEKTRSGLDLSFIPQFGYQAQGVDSTEIAARAKNKALGKPERSGLKWSAREDNELKEAFVKKTPMKDLAKTFQRSSGAIKSRMARIGLIPSDYTADRYAHYCDPEGFKTRKIKHITRKANKMLVDGAEAWLQTPHPKLNMRTPLEAACDIGTGKTLSLLLVEASEE